MEVISTEARRYLTDTGDEVAVVVVGVVEGREGRQLSGMYETASGIASATSGNR